MRFPHSAVACSLVVLCQAAHALTVNADFARDITGQNPGSNPAPSLYVGTGPAPDVGTVWNDLQVPLSATGDLTPAPSVDNPLTFSNLNSSTGTATAIDIQLTSNFYRAFNSTGGTVNNLQRDWVFANNNLQATLTIQGLNPALQYDIYLIGSTYATTFTVNGVGKTASGNAFDGTWSPNGEYVSFAAVTPTAVGEVAVLIQGSGQVNGAIAGLQIVAPGNPVNFLYPNAVATTGGQFSSSYPVSDLLNNGFTSPANTITTVTDYPPVANNYASASGTTQDFDLTFDFAAPTAVDGMHVWNYAYRSGTNGSTSPNNGVNSYALTFHAGVGGTGAAIGSVFTGNLAAVPWNAANAAESVYFGTTYQNARSVVMRVLSNHGGATFTGLNEVAFNGIASATAPAIVSFTVSAPFVQHPATPVLSWQLTGAITSLEIQPGIGSVMGNTANGSGSIAVAPVGQQTYTLTLNGTIQQTVSVIGLPAKEKLHIYLLIGQSNMQGEGSSYNAALDSPVPRVLKFGSREDREAAFVTGGHRLTTLNSVSGSKIGMGLEFAKTLLAAEGDPEVVICLINHALGGTAIQWWEPGVTDTTHSNPSTGQPYKLYDEALQRVADASNYGVIKGVLWHQGEYNSNLANLATTPPADPDGYAAHLQTLVDNLRRDLHAPGLPFICGKLVPDFVSPQLEYRATVEGALADLPNHRSNTLCVDNTGLAGNVTDPIHFDAASQRLLGQRYAAAMIGVYADPFKLYLGGFYAPAQLRVPGRTDPAGDNDHDGYGNFLEYAFLTDPSKPQAVTPVNYTSVTVPGQGDYPAISYRQRFDTEAPQYTVEISVDLVTWHGNVTGQAPVTATVGTPVSNGDGTSTVTVRALQPITNGVGPCFMRVCATSH